jgi:DNA polymerase-3 subunit beta
MSKPSLIFTGDGKAIAEVLQRLAASVTRKTTLPILSCVQLQIRGGRLHATATNLDQMHSAELPVEIAVGKDGDGTCAALGLLAGILARCNGDGVSVTLADGKLAFVAGGRKAVMNVLPVHEFPEIAGLPTDWETVAPGAVASAIRSVAFAVSDEETRYVLNGVYLDSEGLAVATDGRRLAQCGYTDSPVTPLSGVILPTPCLTPIVDLLERHDSVEVAGGEAGIWIRAAGELYYSKVIEGNFPNYKQVIPKFTTPIKITVDRGKLQKALAWAKLYRTAKENSINLAVSGGSMTISVFSPEIGEAEEVIPVIRGEGEMRVGLSSKFLDEFVNREGGDYFTIETQPEKGGDVTSPLMISEENEAFLGVLMPMRIAR